MTTPWLAYRRPQPQARLRLFCFHYAGGSASAYRTWTNALPETIEVCPVQLPGREGRLREPLLVDMPSLIAALAAELATYADLPYAIFGHSMGARVGFELARQWRREGRSMPVHLFASAARAPSRASRMARHQLTDDQLKEQMRQLGGTPEAVLRDQALMQLFLPIVRADFALHETYHYQPEEPFDCGLTALAGEEDREVPIPDLEYWQLETRGPFALHMVPGGHLFLHSSKSDVLRIVQDALCPWT